MLTEKEVRILKEIEKNPLIKQEDLADLLSLSRTAVAAHISNLQKKGFILGRGYFLQYPSTVSVIGGINLAFESKSKERFCAKENNLGSVFVSIKGTIYNIYKFLSQWDSNINYISFIGTDYYGESLLALLKRNNIKEIQLKKVENAETGMLTSLFDNDSQLLGTILSMDLFKNLNLWDFNNILPKIQNSTFLYIDSNYTVEILNEIANINPSSYIIYNTITKTRAHSIDTIAFRFDAICSSIKEINMMYHTNFDSILEVMDFLKKNKIESGIIYEQNQVLLFQSEKYFILKTKNLREYYISRFMVMIKDVKEFSQEVFDHA